MVLGLTKWLGRALDPTNTINNVSNMALQGGWKPVRNVFRGVRGKGSIEKTGRDATNRVKQVITGRRYGKNGEAIDSPNETLMERHINNRATGALHLAADTLSVPLTAAGWAVGGAARGAGIVGIIGAKVGAKATGRIAKEGIDFVGDSALGAMDLVGAMNKTYSGRAALFGIGGAGAIGIGGASAINHSVGSDFAMERGLQFYKGQSIDSVPGTITPSSQMVDEMGQLVETGPSGIDSMGADGDLALALHNLR